MGVRHEHLKSEFTMTRYGRVDLNGDGVVIGRPEKCSEEELLNLPGFLDLVRFPVTKREVIPEPLKVLVSEDGPLKGMDLEDRKQIREIMDGMLQDEKNLNSSGSLDMAKLNGVLRSVGLGPITGAQRDVLVAVT